MARVTTSLAAYSVALVLLLSSCAALEPAETPPPLSPVPGPSEIQVVGTIVGEATVGSITDFELSDGRAITVDLSTKRRVGQGGGSPAILVLGRDDRGEWAVVIGHQDGTPEGCHVLNQLGYDLGDSIAIGGVRWRKGVRFGRPDRMPQPGQPYDQGTRFCLDEIAQVTGIIAP